MHYTASSINRPRQAPDDESERALSAWTALCEGRKNSESPQSISNAAKACSLRLMRPRGVVAERICKKARRVARGVRNLQATRTGDIFVFASSANPFDLAALCPLVSHEELVAVI